jgi:hypothetical protein
MKAMKKLDIMTLQYAKIVKSSLHTQAATKHVCSVLVHFLLCAFLAQSIVRYVTAKFVAIALMKKKPAWMEDATMAMAKCYSSVKNMRTLISVSAVGSRNVTSI